ncbi:hypothetical protein K450DRAFT_231668 [Umbelopsis ramanniana AG]|uniref:Secreted protein n=1 Tax=Umbelopsis ramanniana AG TaxID=1314678 RepID=A0AAD5ED37_UMBRA|nr:uncharacterized protein K450DRAFT_231668 [Umbelopsis ramanniana AG]KAI8581513.1 hypothetical protein K450DRAFT_231668 [Umbelopsis ramanniana AG]
MNMKRMPAILMKMLIAVVCHGVLIVKSQRKRPRLVFSKTCKCDHRRHHVLLPHPAHTLLKGCFEPAFHNSIWHILSCHMYIPCTPILLLLIIQHVLVPLCHSPTFIIGQTCICH